MTTSLHFFDQPYEGAMNSKDLVIELVRRLPDGASILDIAREIEFVAEVREAIAGLPAATPAATPDPDRS
jgi:hypothetical protein